MKINLTAITASLLGLFIGISFPLCSISKIQFPLNFFPYINGEKNYTLASNELSLNHTQKDENFKIYAQTNPKGAERLPPGIVKSESDFYQHRLWGDPNEDLPYKQRYLVTFTVGSQMKNNVNEAVQKFSENFTILLFHYDGRINEWDEFDWSKKAIHISATKQAKWWYAKRFLHPDIVAPYEYIFIWDEDLGTEHFNGEEYIKLVKEYGLEISQPGAEGGGLQWEITKRKSDSIVHKETKEKPEWCSDPHLPPCAAFIEIMAPVFSRDAWRCVWHMIQNDLVHGWGLDHGFRRCVEPAHEKMGVVDTQWIIHRAIPTLKNQGRGRGNASSEGIEKRERLEWKMFETRMEEAETEYYKMMGITPPNSNLTTNSTNLS